MTIQKAIGKELIKLQINNGLEAFRKKKRTRKSKARDDFKEGEVRSKKTRMAECIHCHTQFKRGKSGTSSSMLRHIKSCVRQMLAQKKLYQKKINFTVVDSSIPGHSFLHDGKFDVEKMRDVAANQILMHEHLFSIVEEEGFNIV